MTRLTRQVVVFLVAFVGLVVLGGAVAVAQQDRTQGQSSSGAQAAGAEPRQRPAAQGQGQGQAGRQSQSSSQRQGKFEVYEDQGGKFRWRLKSSNGQVIASSGQAFADKAGARAAVESVKRTAADATIEEQAQTASSSEPAEKSDADADSDAKSDAKSDAGTAGRNTAKGRTR